MGDDRVALCRSLVCVPALSGIYVVSDVTQGRWIVLPFGNGGPAA